MDFDDYENNIEACALVIEDLKSEDPTVKVQAVSKLHSIAQLIGKDRVKEELIPYLIEIVEEKDNEDEFLIQLTEQLGQLATLLDQADVYNLLSLFEILVSMEEPSIRDKAIAKIKAISQGQDGSYFSGHYLNMVKRLSLWDHYPSRVAACYLFAPCYPFIPENEKVEIRQLYSELAHDDTPMVRRAAAANLADIVAAVEPEIVSSDIIPLFTMLVKDDIDAVKLKAIESSIYLLPFYAKPQISNNLLVLLKNTDPELKSWRVRYTLAETIAAFCPNLDVDLVRREIFPIYESMLKDTEQEVRSCALMKLSEVFDKLTEDQIQNNVVPSINTLITDTSLHVRLSVTHALSELCRSLKPDSIIKNLLPLIQSLLKDDTIEVKSATIKVFKAVNEKVGRERIEKEIFPIIEAISQEKQWRCRLSLIEVLPELCKGVGYEVYKAIFQEFLFGFITDHYYLIREQSIENIRQLIQAFGQDKMMEQVRSTFQTLLTNENYLFRMTALTTLSRLSQTVDTNGFQTLLDMTVDKLGAEKVPNVKFVLIRTIQELKDKISSPFMRSRVFPLLEKWKNDQDCDVAYFASDALQNLKK